MNIVPSRNIMYLPEKRMQANQNSRYTIQRNMLARVASLDVIKCTSSLDF